MPSFAFILGRTPQLSIAEILRLFAGRREPHRVVAANQAALIVDVPDSIDAPAFFARLGGSVKLVRVTDVLPAADVLPAFTERWNSERLLSEFIPQTERKIVLGVSAYGEHRSAVQSIADEGRRHLMAMKRELQGDGYSVRVVGERGEALSSASVGEQHLIDLGAELVAVLAGDHAYLGRTVAVQAYEEFSETDYGRPARDPKSGMLPPKLARMMLNFAVVDPAAALLLDPFCGSGTVVTEALQLGFRKVIAADSSNEAVDATRKNVAWFLQRGVGRGAALEYIHATVRDLPHRLRGSVDAIVTEPSLGPALRGRPTEEQAQGIIRELSRLFRDAFQAFTRILSPGGTIVMIVPVLRAKGGEVTVDLRSIVGSAFSIVEPIPPDAVIPDALRPSAKKTFRYFRPGQKVERDIVMLTKH